MSAFEFILILVAIVAGFAISEILASWGRLIRARAPVRDAALYCFASLLLLNITVRYVWLLWARRAAEWYFLEFLLHLSPVLVLALAAYVIALPRTTAPGVADHYFAQARPFYILLAVFIVLWTVANVASFSSPLPGADQASLIAGRTVTAAGLLVLARTRSPALHWLLLSALLLTLVALSFVAVPHL